MRIGLNLFLFFFSLYIIHYASGIMCLLFAIDRKIRVSPKQRASTEFRLPCMNNTRLPNPVVLFILNARRQ